MYECVLRAGGTVPPACMYVFATVCAHMYAYVHYETPCRQEDRLVSMGPELTLAAELSESEADRR